MLARSEDINVVAKDLDVDVWAELRAFLPARKSRAFQHFDDFTTTQLTDQ
jgi:hypothetical protein